MKRRITSIVLALCLALGLLPVHAWAAEENPGGDGGGLTWTYSSHGSGRTLTISGKGAIGTVPHRVAADKDDVTYLYIEEGVTAVEGPVFAGWTNLRGVNLPESLTALDPSAFNNCTQLASISYCAPKWKWEANKLPKLDPEPTYAPGGECGDGVVWSYGYRSYGREILMIERDPRENAGNPTYMIERVDAPDHSVGTPYGVYAVLIIGGENGVRGAEAAAFDGLKDFPIAGSTDLVLHVYDEGDGPGFEYSGSWTVHKVNRVERKEPTCEEDGNEQGLICEVPDCPSRGGYMGGLKPDVIPTTGHAWAVNEDDPESRVVGEYSSCYGEGSMTIYKPVCMRCGKLRDGSNGGSYDANVALPARHDWIVDEDSPDSKLVETDPTCGQEGVKKIVNAVCGRCLAVIGEYIIDTTPATGKHTWGGWVTTKEPTGTEAGTKTRACSVCGATEEDSIPATGKPEEPNSCTVTFNANGGTFSDGKEIAAQKTERDGTIKNPPTPTRGGYDLAGWAFDEKGDSKLNDGYVFTADTTVYAQWTEKKNPDGVHNITFNANGGTFSGDSAEVVLQTEKDGTIKSLPVPTRAGYSLAGWDLEKPGGSNLNDGYVFTADTTVYARWTKKPGVSDPGDDSIFEPIDPVTVTFNANGGSGGTTMKTGTDGKLSALPRDPVRSGYTFDGWYFGAPDDDLKIYTSTVFRQNTTVYARWTQNNTSGSTDPSTPSNPSNPSTPSNPSNPSTPSDGTYLIGTPGSVTGGSYNVSHASAPAGTLVTIQVTPWSNYTLGRLSVTRTDTGRAVSVANYGGQYAFTMPASDVRLGITFNLTYTGGYVPTQPTAATRYVDWYYSGGSIYHATSGLVPTGSVLTRDMFIAVLYNLDGSGSGDPTIWAATNNIVPDVVMSELWGPDRSITREQAAMILYCYAQYKGYNTSRTMSLSGYRDAGQIRSMAVPAMAWCCATGLMTGTTANTLSPLGSLTCGQANTIIYRFLSGVAR